MWFPSFSNYKAHYYNPCGKYTNGTRFKETFNDLNNDIPLNFSPLKMRTRASLSLSSIWHGFYLHLRIQLFTFPKGNEALCIQTWTNRDATFVCVCGAYLSHLCLHTVFSFQSTLSLFLSLCLFFSLMLISFLRLFLSIPRLLCNLVLQESLPFFSNVYNLRLEIHVVTEKREFI